MPVQLGDLIEGALDRRHSLDTSSEDHYRPRLMDMLQKLGRFVVGGRDAIEDPADPLRHAYLDSYERMLLLEQHASLAPQEYSRNALVALTHTAKQQVDRLRGILRERGLGPVPEPAPPALESSSNHWGRLVEDLERHQASSRNLRESATEFADSHPDVAGIFRRLCQEDVRACERLRALIARADPQALD